MKQSGLGDRLFVGGYNLSGDIGALDTISCPRTTADVTGIDKDAYERILLTKDGAISYTAFFNDAAGQAHPVLSTLPRTDVAVTYCRSAVLGAPSACMIGKQINYDPSRGADGTFTFKVDAQASGYGLEWGRQLTAGLRQDGAAANGTSVDHTTVSTAFGWQAYLHVFAVTGTSVTVTIQDSADDSSFTALTGGAFTAVTPAGAPTTQRLAGGTTATVRRYLRVATSGTFSDAQFAVTFVRNEAASEAF